MFVTFIIFSVLGLISFVGFIFLVIAEVKEEKKQKEGIKRREEIIEKKRKEEEEEEIEKNTQKIIDEVPHHYHLLKDGISKDLTREKIEALTEEDEEKDKYLFSLRDDEGEIHEFLCFSININVNDKNEDDDEDDEVEDDDEDDEVEDDDEDDEVEDDDENDEVEDDDEDDEVEDDDEEDDENDEVEDDDEDDEVEDDDEEDDEDDEVEDDDEEDDEDYEAEDDDEDYEVEDDDEDDEVEDDDEEDDENDEVEDDDENYGVEDDDEEGDEDYEVEVVVLCEVFETFFEEILDINPHLMGLKKAVEITMKPLLACAISHLYEEISLHHSALTRNLERAFTTNDYGAVTQDNRTDALEEFFTSVDFPVALFGFDFASKLVYEKLEALNSEQKEQGFDPDTLPLDGHEFEYWVSNALRNFGWDANVTSGSGDQGIDVIATKNGKTLGIQCKLYNNPVGNKAIQEAHAGKTFYGADEVCVLSNAPYTPSAKKLAHATNVKLFSHHDIPLLYEKTFNS